jgi:ankyrin repeat protein
MSATRKGVWRTYWSTQSRDLFGHIGEDNWYMVEKMLHKNPLLVEEADPFTGELPLHKIVEHASAWTLLIDMILTLYPKAVVHKDFDGGLPIHHAAQADNLKALEIIYESYKAGAKDADGSGRFPIHVAAECGSIESIKYLIMKEPHGVHTMTSGGSSLPLHFACKKYSSVGVITSLLRTTLHFTLASRTDENGELPLHLLLRCGSDVDVVAVKTLLTCHLKAIGTRDKSGDIPLHIALKNKCKPAVIEALLSHFPGSSVVMDGDGHSPLFLALCHSAEDETSVSLIKYAPQMVTMKDDRTGKLPIEIATDNDLSLFIVYRLLKQDMPIHLKERVQVRLIPHFYSWNHILLDVGDRYYQVVSKILQQCTQPQVLALAHVEDSEGKIALASATPICRHEIRVMLRLFNTLELVKQRPAFTNGASDTEIFYALRYEPPAEQSDLFSTDYKKEEADDGDYTEDWDDDLSQMSDASKRGTMNDDEANMCVAEKLKLIRQEQGQHVIAKITPRSDIVERELRIRKDFNLSRHYVPSVISVHHTVHHGAYQNASAEPAYCITMEGADATIEHQMLDYRRAGKAFPHSELKRVGVSLLHLHENGLVHTDFGPHSVGKFGALYKLLGVGGCVRIGDETNPKHGIYHSPEAISVENVFVDGVERKTAKVVPVLASPAIDLWAFGNMVYESVAGAPLSAFSHRGQRVKSSNLAKIARWDDNSLQRALRLVDTADTLARDVISKLLHPNPDERFQSIREAIADPFFNTDCGDRKIKRDKRR